jgi:hypothetical protein
LKNFKLSCIVFTLLILGVVFVSCNKPSVIGLSVQPASDQLNVRFTDTVTLTTYSILIDSVRSDNASSNLLGCYVDPVFGKTYASFYAQTDLLNFNNSFGTNPIADSIVLSLSYNGYYGDTTTPQSLNVYQLNQILSQDSAYFSNQNFGYINEAIGSAVFYPHPNDSVSVGGINQAPQLRITLKNSIANNILNASTTALADNTDFISFFKGIYIKPSDVSIIGKGAILYFDAQSPYSGITIYYHNTTSLGLTFNLVFDGGTARVNHFEHQYKGTVINQEFANHSLGQNTLYCQSMGGVETYIDFPNIKHFIDSGKVSINQAELVVLVSQDITNPLYPLPGSMILYGLDTLGNEISLPDFTLSTYEIPLVNTNEYDFFINSYVQQLLNDSASTVYNYNHLANNGLHLVCSFGSAQANRMIIGGPQNPSYPMKLKITYTKL